MTPEIIIGRLLNIKYLYQLGVQQSNLSERIAFSALLCFHDSLDLFVQLAAEFKGVSVQSKPFLLNYFDALPQLTLKSSVKKINDRRNALKHNGQIPSAIELNESRIIAQLFLEENTEEIFELDFNKIYLSSLIKNKTVRDFLVKVEGLIQAAQYFEAVIEMAKLFSDIREGRHYSRSAMATQYAATQEIKRGIWVVHDSSGISGLRGIREPDNAFHVVDGYVFDAFSTYEINFQFIREALQMTSIGVDSMEYVRFKKCIPEALIQAGDQRNNPVWQSLFDDIYTEPSCAFALDFITKFLIKLESLGHQ